MVAAVLTHPAYGTVMHVWHHVVRYLLRPGRPASPELVGGTAVVALAAVASPRIWPLSRTVVTIAHEGGHALMALLTGRRLNGVRVLRSTAGVTVSEGSLAGPGIVLTTAAGYTAPPLLGLGAAALLATGHLVAMLLLGLVGLIGLAFAIRNAFGLLAVAVTAAIIGLILWRGSGLGEAAFGYVMTWFLLLGGVRPVFELQTARRRSARPRTDADQLARLTGLPGWLWVGVFGIIALAALGLSTLWLVPR
jgi:Peptidase M50B-like